jgi:hypothetical protein
VHSSCSTPLSGPSGDDAVGACARVCKGLVLATCWHGIRRASPPRPVTARPSASLVRPMRSNPSQLRSRSNAEPKVRGRAQRLLDDAHRAHAPRRYVLRALAWPTPTQRVSMSPTANTFKAGHRLRVQVSGSVHPRFARNLGTGEPLATATTLRASHHEILNDPDHASMLHLPRCTFSPRTTPSSSTGWRARRVVRGR